MIKVNENVVELNRFPDNSLNIKVNPDLFGKDVVITWNYENDSEFMALVFLTNAYKINDCYVSLFLPYVPYARMDRVENPNDILSIKYFAELINNLGFENVFVLDVHSSVTQAVIKNCILIPATRFITETIKIVEEIECEKPLIFFPDEGAMKRYSNKINMEYAFGIKNRDWKTGKILNLDIMGVKPEQVKGRDVLIIDDICSYGGTFYYSAKKLKEMGAKNIYLYVSHCEKNILYGSFDKQPLLSTGLIKRVFTTDSIFKKKDIVFDTDKLPFEVFNLSIKKMKDNNDCCKCECSECKGE